MAVGLRDALSGLAADSSCAPRLLEGSPGCWPVTQLPLFVGGLQAGHGLLPVLHHGQLLLAAGGRPLSSHAPCHLLLLRTEVAPGICGPRLGYVLQGTVTASQVGKDTEAVSAWVPVSAARLAKSVNLCDLRQVAWWLILWPQFVCQMGNNS